MKIPCEVGASSDYARRLRALPRAPHQAQHQGGRVSGTPIGNQPIIVAGVPTNHIVSFSYGPQVWMGPATP
eukprot:5181638-Pyramimonas_sp.AAC.1